jgi:hypothetical protein
VQGGVRRKGSCIQCTGFGGERTARTSEDELGWPMIKMINLTILIDWGKLRAWLPCPQPAPSRTLQL